MVKLFLGIRIHKDNFVKVNRMNRNNLKTSKQLQKEHINCAMKEFFSRGGRIKKINTFDRSFSYDDDSDDYSWMEATNTIALRKSR